MKQRNGTTEEKSGRIEGGNTKKLEIAKKLKEENVDVDIIIRTTGLTKEEIEKL